MSSRAHQSGAAGLLLWPQEVVQVSPGGRSDHSPGVLLEQTLGGAVVGSGPWRGSSSLRIEALSTIAQ